MFTYSDAQSFRPSLLDMFEEYWRRLPEYQGLSGVDGLEFKRLLFAFFPTYKSSPLPPGFDRCEPATARPRRGRAGARNGDAAAARRRRPRNLSYRRASAVARSDG